MRLALGALWFLVCEAIWNEDVCLKENLFQEVACDNALHQKRNENATGAEPVVEKSKKDESVSLLVSAPELESTIKFMYDYASADAGGKIVESTPTARNVRAILKSHPDAYMMSRCADPVSVVVALPEQILIQYVAFESQELFSSFYGKVAIMVSGAYPKDQWIVLGILSLDDSRSKEVFDLTPICKKLGNSACWITRVKFQVLSYNRVSNSDYCTLTRFQVFGSTLLQGLHSKVTQGSMETNDTLVVETDSEPWCPRPPSRVFEDKETEEDYFDEEREFRHRMRSEELAEAIVSILASTDRAADSKVAADLPTLSSADFLKESLDKKETFRMGWEALMQSRRSSDELLNTDKGLMTVLEDIGVSVKPEEVVDRSVITVGNDQTTAGSYTHMANRKLLLHEPNSYYVWPGHTLNTPPRSQTRPYLLDTSTHKETSPSLWNEKYLKDHGFTFLNTLIEHALKLVSTVEPDSKGDETSPPLLALVDRVANLEGAMSNQKNITLAHLTILRSLVDHTANHSYKLDKIASFLDLVIEKSFWSNSVLRNILSNEIFSNLLLVACRTLLEDYVWGNANGKRQVCVAAKLFAQLDESTLLTTEGLSEFQTTRRLLDDLSEWNIRVAVECRLRRLQQSLGQNAAASMGFSEERLQYLEDIHAASDYYRQFLKEQASMFGLRHIIAWLRALIQAVENTLYQVCMVMDLAAGIDDYFKDNSVAVWYRSLKQTSSNLLNLLECDPIVTFMQVAVLEISCTATLNRLFALGVAVLILDTALRIRDAEHTLRSLTYSPPDDHSRSPRFRASDDEGLPDWNLTAGPDEETASLPARKSTRHEFFQTRSISQQTGRRWYYDSRDPKACSAPPSATRIGGGLGAALAYSLEPLNRFRGNFWTRKGTTDSAIASDPDAELHFALNSSQGEDSPRRKFSSSVSLSPSPLLTYSPEDG
eukprot:Blabericola_migrator_1__2650@NODE_1751_length_3859_cov_45_437236_g1128_i0_p1_GENE_NODE_1751_length_3859_cov_45_437236_g1128_i0NODE_1751_length_3859_cov_45_437236_g1128_i0_p1_ORF_typecomplete_len939_score148_05Sad1_UNC/PF07738_13/8_2e10Glyco_trans_1_2/PF13524_6/1_7e02Glyco_trans_1_2/PF13524_6/3_3_NODE_1751_length_3859_cov_45_437236_g1128_i072823